MEPPARPRQIARHDLGDGETGIVQCRGQKSGEAASADDGDGRVAFRSFSRLFASLGFSAHRRSIPYIVVMAKSADDKSTSKKSAGNKSGRARVLSSRVSYRGPVFSVTTDEVEEPGGVRARRDVIRHSGSIVVLAVDDAAKTASTAEPRVLLERQYRHAAQSMMWELPAGRIDDGETALTAAKRELLEETGYIPKEKYSFAQEIPGGTEFVYIPRRRNIRARCRFFGCRAIPFSSWFAEAGPAFLRESRLSRRNHDYLSGPRPCSRRGPTRAG